MGRSGKATVPGFYPVDTRIRCCIPPRRLTFLLAGPRLGRFEPVLVLESG